MNIRRLILCGVVAPVCLAVMAVPAKRGTRTFVQPDGTTISLKLVGDEFSHTLSTLDGLAVTRGADGYFYYAGASGATAVRASNVADRTDAESAFVQRSGNAVSVSGLFAARRGAVGARRVARAPKKADDTGKVPSSGSPRVPVLLVQYKDYKFKDADPVATFTDFFCAGKVSAYQYFVDQSNGKYTPQFDIYGPVTLPGNRVEYGGNDVYGNDVGLCTMVAEGCLGLDASVDFSRYDNDGDGECDVVIVLYAGDGEASSYEEDAEDSVWPCQGELGADYSDYGRDLNLDNVKVSKFAVFNELNGLDLTQIDGIGTFCHEYSHCLDLPDFYDTGSGTHFGMAHWSLMDYGSYNNDGYTPLGYSAYEKAFMGWLEIEEGAADTYYTLPVFNQKSAATDRAVKLTNPNDPNEYFVIENRANQGWDEYMPAEGLLITHVTYDATAWYENVVNNYNLQRMTPVPADNNLKLNKINYFGETFYEVDEDDLVGDLWPYRSATDFTDTSTPAAKVNTGGLLGKPVTDITRNADGSISFWVMKTPKPVVAQPLNPTHSVPSSTSLNVSWNAGDASDVTYTLEVTEHRDITYKLVSSTVFDNDNHGWSTTDYTIIDDLESAIRLGSSNRTGSVKSPAFTTDGSGLVTVRFNSKYYSTDESQVKVSIVDASGNTVKSETVALTSSFADYSVLLQGAPESEVAVKIEAVAKKKRVCLHKADIYTGDATELAVPRTVVEQGDTQSRIVTGITATTYTVEGLKANGVYDYRVKAVPVDTDNYDESPWTETLTADLSSYSGVDNISVDIVADLQPVYYTLQGVRLGTAVPAPGLYVVRRGAVATKVYIK